MTKYYYTEDHDDLRPMNGIGYVKKGTVIERFSAEQEAILKDSPVFKQRPAHGIDYKPQAEQLGELYAQGHPGEIFQGGAVEADAPAPETLTPAAPQTEAPATGNKSRRAASTEESV